MSRVWFPDLVWDDWPDGSMVVYIPNHRRGRNRASRIPLSPWQRRRARRLTIRGVLVAGLGVGVLAGGVRLLASGEMVLGILDFVAGLVFAMIGAMVAYLESSPPRGRSVLLAPAEAAEFLVIFAEARRSLGVRPERSAEIRVARELWHAAEELKQRSSVSAERRGSGGSPQRF